MDTSDIFQSIRYGDVETVRRLLQEFPALANERDGDGQTPLMHVAQLDRNQPDMIGPMVIALLKAGADVNALEFRGGNTALHFACMTANIPFLITLMGGAGAHLHYYVRNFDDKLAMDCVYSTMQSMVLSCLAHGRFRKLPKGTDTSYDMRLVVVGVGPAGAALFINLVDELLNWKKWLIKDLGRLEIILVDRNRKLGTGTPYSPEKNSPTSLLNIAAAGMSILGKDPQDFVNWLRVLSETPSSSKENLLAEALGAAYDYGLCDAVANPGGFYPRLLYGQYVTSRVQDYLRIAGQNGIHVAYLTEGEVTGELLDEAGNLTGVRLRGREIDGEISLPVTNIYYATGHWQEKIPEGGGKPYERAPGYIPFPANIETLTGRGLFAEPCHIALLGSSLSAIDAIYSILLHPSVGTLTRGSGRLDYRYELKDPNWKVTAYSRRGLLPRVRPLANEDFKLTRLTPAAFRKLQYSMPDHHVPLKLVIELLNEEYSRAFARPIDVEKEADPLQTNKAFETSKDPFNLVSADLLHSQWGDRRTEGQTYVRWYQVIHALFPVIKMIYRQFTREERKTFDQVYNSHFLWGFAPMPDVSAAILLAMHNAGALDVWPVARGSMPEVSDGGFKIAHTDASGTLRTGVHPFLIGTTGLANMFYNDISELSQDLIVNRRVMLHDPRDSEREGSVFISDNGAFEVLDERGSHSPARRGVGYFIHAQIFDVQAVPSVVRYGSQVAQLYTEEFAYLQSGAEIYPDQAARL